MPSRNSIENDISNIFKTKRPVVVILGPTAVGKTELAIQLAEWMNGEIISADSRLLYRGMDIGTAKPSREERARVPHHLIDVANPDETWSLAKFQRELHYAITQIHQRNHLPFLVGGTGQYIHAFTEGWLIPEVKADPLLRKILEKWAAEISATGLHKRLAILDPRAAQTIDPRNIRRTIRALEVIFTTGKRFSTQRKRITTPFQILQIGLTRPRHELYDRVDQRIEVMLQSGLSEEVNHLLQQGYSSDLPTMSAIGYFEISKVIHDKMMIDEAIKLMKRRTRVLIRRQANWFKLDDPEIHWFNYSEHALTDIEISIRTWLTHLD